MQNRGWEKGSNDIVACGERVAIRSMCLGDIEFIRAIYSDPDGNYYDTGNPDYCPDDAYYKTLEDSIKSGLPLCRYIIENEESEAIGFVSHREINIDNGFTLVDIRIAKNFQNNGYGSDSMTCFSDWLFKKYNLDRVSLMVLDFNKRAIRVYLKCGFDFDGRNFIKDGKKWRYMTLERKRKNVRN